MAKFKEPVSAIADRSWRSYCERAGYVNIGDSAARELFKSGFIAALQLQNDMNRGGSYLQRCRLGEYGETSSQENRTALSAR